MLLNFRAVHNPKYQFLTLLSSRPLATSSILLYLDLPNLASSKGFDVEYSFKNSD